MSLKEELSLQLKSLRLPSMNLVWEELAERAQNQALSHAEFLNELCTHELSERQSRRLKRHLQEADLPKSKTLEKFNFEVLEGIKKESLLEFSQEFDWLKSATNILIFGPSGLGKTHLASGIGYSLVFAGYRVLFQKAANLLQKLEKAKREHSLPGFLDRLEKYDCLILDDFGYVDPTIIDSSPLFSLIDHWYESKPLILTCNHSFDQWGNIFSDKRMAVAAIDRLVHHSRIIQLKGKSYRRRDKI